MALQLGLDALVPEVVAADPSGGRLVREGLVFLANLGLLKLAVYVGYFLTTSRLGPFGFPTHISDPLSTVDCAADPARDRSKAQAVPGPSILVAGARFELATFGL